jgi:hypothetical protein
MITLNLTIKKKTPIAQYCNNTPCYKHVNKYFTNAATTYTCTFQYWCSHSFACINNVLTPCRRAVRKLVIALPCIVDGSRVSLFSYRTSCTCVYHLIWLTYCFKVIDSLMQDAWVSSYKQTDQSWPPIFRTISLQQRDHSFRYSVCFPLVAIIEDTSSDVSDYIDNESLNSDSDVPATSSRKQLRSSVVVVISDSETSTIEE